MVYVQYTCWQMQSHVLGKTHTCFRITPKVWSTESQTWLCSLCWDMPNISWLLSSCGLTFLNQNTDLLVCWNCGLLKISSVRISTGRVPVDLTVGIFGMSRTFSLNMWRYPWSFVYVVRHDGIVNHPFLQSDMLYLKQAMGYVTYGV